MNSGTIIVPVELNKNAKPVLDHAKHLKMKTQ